MDILLISFLFSRSDGSEENLHTQIVRYFPSLPSLRENRDDMSVLEVSPDTRMFVGGAYVSIIAFSFILVLHPTYLSYT